MAVAGRATGRRRIHARRACRGKTACRIGTGPQRTGFLRSLLCARMVEAKKSLCPVLGHRQEKQAGEGEFEGKALSHRQQRCDRMAAAGRARCDAGSYGHRQQRCDRMAAAGRARCDAGSYGHRQQRCDRMAAAGRARCDAGSYGHRQQRCDRMAAAGRARCDAGSYGHRQQRCDRMAAAGRARSRERRLTGSPATRRGPESQRRWRYGPDGHRRQDAG